MRPDIPAALRARVLTPLCKRLEGRLGVTIRRSNGYSELVAISVVGCAVAVDAKEEWSALGE
ncbi:hypothetical protein KDQ40_18315 (plasmid) [Haloarcula marismortui ATCC 33800]|uniref:Uncharacterized protein n=1 Tax=Haloarcula marismortui ATCC 33800 TaxID=662476 RepID=A0A8T8KM26_9EURY|nr:hypothetical protein KDQ40_18315 [Haloarcula sinaiiensis ATCC 33800]